MATYESRDAAELVRLKKLLMQIGLAESTIKEWYVISGAVMCFYIENEGLSVIENAALLGLPVPGIIKGALDNLKKK